jgi:hypothetical protein
MDQDDDVEHLFSWLQTPELRYREFAGAREITDTVVTWQPRPDLADTPVAPSRNVQLTEEYPPDQFPDQTYAPVDIVERAPVVERATVIERSTVVERSTTVERGPAMIAPMPISRAEPPPVAGSESTIGFVSAGHEPAVRPPLIQVPAPRQAAVPHPAPLPPPLAASAPPPTMAAPAAGGGLLGGAYRDGTPNGHPAEAEPPAPAGTPHRNQRSLDAVFGRLADPRNRLPDPRERPRVGPGSPAGRPR